MKMHFLITWCLVVIVVAALAVTVADQKQQITQGQNEIQQLSADLGSLQAAVANLASTSNATAAKTAEELAAVSAVANRPQVVPKTQSQLLQAAVAQVSPAVVSIRGIRPETGKTASQGTGFLIRSNGYLVTNNHVVSDTSLSYSIVFSSGTQVTGTVMWRSPSDDIAIVKISGSGYPFIPLGTSSSLQLGQTVFAIGNVLGQFSNSVSVGVVSGLNRTITASDQKGNTVKLVGVIQTDSAINPGNSGGPLVNLNGEAAGVNVAMAEDSQSVGFALPIEKVTDALKSLGI
jgi:S1-C subfamily serine protease